MSIRVIFFSDTHLGFDYPLRPRAERPRRGPDFFANFQRVLDHARSSRADLVIHGGDFFHRSKVAPGIVDLAYQALFEFADSGIPIAIVPGNHERSVLPPSLFLNHPSIHVFDHPRTFRFQTRGGSVAVSGFPYLRNIRTEFARVVKECEAGRHSADHRLLCLHHAVEGAVVGPAGFVFRDAADVIDRRHLPTDFDCVLAGHIHRQQVLGYDVPVVYCGSIERTSYAEQHETKGFCELTLHHDAPQPTIEFHQLPSRPMVDFDGLRYVSRSALLDAFGRQSADWASNAIVHVRLAQYPDRQTAGALRRLVDGPLTISRVSVSGAR